jgi:hypothetical protein
LAAVVSAIGLYRPIAPSAGQSSTTGEPSLMAARTSESSVMPSWYRPSATSVTTSGMVLT